MAGHILMGHLMLINANKSEEYKTYARVFIKKVQAENKDKFEYIASTDMKDVDAFRQN
jgi:hypothetical protein